MSTGSAQTLSQEDSNSLNSRSSMEFAPSPVDDKERLLHIDSAIKWIKDELAGMRDRDKSILRYLSQAQTSIESIQRQQKHSLKVHTDIEKRHLFGSTEDLNNTQKEQHRSAALVNNKYGTLATNTARPFISSGALCTSPTMQSPITLDAGNSDDLLSSFLGEKKLTTPKVMFPFDQPVEEKEKTSTAAGKGEKEEQKERHGSAVSELQNLRKQLKMETKRELENFDKAFDTPKLLEVSEDSKKSYRYSILNRMEELLNSAEGSHVRQHSEPAMSGSVSEWALSSSSKKPHPKQDFHSFRYVSKHEMTGMTRSDSAGIPKGGVKLRGGGTHYDTTVIGKRKSRPSSRNSTLERRENHPLHYSIDSLSEHSDVSDHDSPEHKIGTAGAPHSSAFDQGDRYSPEIHPELTPLSPLLNHSQAFEDYLKGNLQVGSQSAPLSRKNGLKTNDTWL